MYHYRNSEHIPKLLWEILFPSAEGAADVVNWLWGTKMHFVFPNLRREIQLQVYNVSFVDDPIRTHHT